ncbi:hypothetical protein [Paenibacillus sp. HJGM_3]|uniref:hypothetical protein n=1 Tax=Paenibacillus sp. HJGM_3 TaxID=3379816 RepID=UPI00385F8851
MDIHMDTARAYTPYLLIWGAQWILQALLQYSGNAEPPSLAVTVSLWTAVALSAVVFVLRLARGRKEPAAKELTSSPRYRASSFLVPLVVVLASAGLLLYVQPLSYILIELLRPLVLALLYSLLGVWLRRELMYLGVWLWALTAVLALWFLGYASLVLLFFGGLSLLACAAILWMHPVGQAESETAA